jgi:hypothetical protein
MEGHSEANSYISCNISLWMYSTGCLSNIPSFLKIVDYTHYYFSTSETK